MRLTRVGFLALLLATAVSLWQAFPSAPSERAAVVCKPVRWLARAAALIASSMDDAGRVGTMRQPWHEDVHRACLRVTERLFIAGGDS